MRQMQCPNCSGFRTHTKLESWLKSACACAFVVGCFGSVYSPLAFPIGAAVFLFGVTVGRVLCQAFVRAVHGTWVCDICEYKWAGPPRPAVAAHAAAVAYRAGVVSLAAGTGACGRLTNQ